MTTGILQKTGDKFAIQNAQQAVLNRSEAWKALLQNNASGQVVNNAGTVHYDDYKDLTTDVIKAREFMNVGVNDLIAAGLSRGSKISDTIVQYETMNTFAASVSMDASNRMENQSDYAINWIPQPIFHTDFFIPWRQEGFSYKNSDGIEESVFRVNELQDTVLFNGADLGVKVSGQDAPLYGYTNHPQTLTSTIVDWADPANSDAVTGEAVALVGELRAGGRVIESNSCVMYVANDVWSNMQNDYATAKGDRTIKERIEAISEILRVSPQKDLVDGSVVIVELRSRTVSLSVAQMPVAVPWVKGHALENGRFTIYSSMVAKIKADRNGNTGIIYATKA